MSTVSNLNLNIHRNSPASTQEIHDWSKQFWAPVGTIELALIDPVTALVQSYEIIYRAGNSVETTYVLYEAATDICVEVVFYHTTTQSAVRDLGANLSGNLTTCTFALTGSREDTITVKL